MLLSISAADEEIIEDIEEELFEPIEIYIIPHSHTDAGWVQTYE